MLCCAGSDGDIGDSKFALTSHLITMEKGNSRACALEKEKERPKKNPDLNPIYANVWPLLTPLTGPRVSVVFGCI